MIGAPEGGQRYAFPVAAIGVSATPLELYGLDFVR